MMSVIRARGGGGGLHSVPSELTLQWGRQIINVQCIPPTPGSSAIAKLELGGNEAGHGPATAPPTPALSTRFLHRGETRVLGDGEATHPVSQLLSVGPQPLRCQPRCRIPHLASFQAAGGVCSPEGGTWGALGGQEEVPSRGWPASSAAPGNASSSPGYPESAGPTKPPGQEAKSRE